tara:strand:+ start:17 stop:745 length:729 start_codon:yes stop_codon:yes gene_type:complete
MLRFFIIFYVLFSSILFSQNSVEKSVWNKELYDKYNERNFINFQSFNNIINLKKIDYPLLHAAVFYCTNIERIKKARAALKWSLNLEIAAYNHSKAMVEKNFFDHLSDKKIEKRYKSAGILNPIFAENIATEFGLKYKKGNEYYTHEKNSSINGEFRFSYKNDEANLLPFHSYLSFAKELVKSWMKSNGHRKNILSTNGLELGVGVYFKNENGFPMFYSTQNFQRYEFSKITESKSPLPPGW